MKNKIISVCCCFMPLFLILILALLNDTYSLGWIEPNIYIWLGIYSLALSVVQIYNTIKQKYLIILLSFKHIPVFILCLFMGLLCFAPDGGTSLRLTFAACFNFLICIIAMILFVLELRMKKEE